MESMEAVLVDTANVLASLVERTSRDSEPDPSGLAATMNAAVIRRFSANLFHVIKNRVELRVLLTDSRGRVLYDSDGKDLGKDYSRWNDIFLALKGTYGARSSKSDPAAGSIKYVSAPVHHGDQIIGAVTVAKPASSMQEFIGFARLKVIEVALEFALLAALAGMLVSFWITRPIARLTSYVNDVRQGKRLPMPVLQGREMRELGDAFRSMREALEGKKYIERYTQTLTHELKSPLSAIRGAAEILTENPPESQRKLFLANITTEAARITSFIDRMLLLSSLENLTKLETATPCDLKKLALEVTESFRPQLVSKTIRLESRLEEATVLGDAFLIRQALSNLLQNAVEFSPPGGVIRQVLEVRGGLAIVTVEDNGPGIPDYARERIFERFYSLPRPGTGKKSSGLGLSFVREVATLHSGEAHIENLQGTGAKATFSLPVAFGDIPQGSTIGGGDTSTHTPLT
jgi:two-component system sensor histidine kinase CreC